MANSYQSKSFPILLIMVIISSITIVGASTGLNETLKYTSCTPERNCLTCENDYICKQCAPGQKYCPKRCLTCTNQTLCDSCQLGFDLYTVSQKGWRICANLYHEQLDYHRIRNNPQIYSYGNPNPQISTKCEKGYYFESNIKFCQKCFVPNCETCVDSIHCSVCENDHFLFNGLYPTIVDIKQTKESNYSEYDQEAVAVYFGILIFGIIIGCCLTCILIKIIYCVRRRCRNLYRRFFQRNNPQELNQQISMNSQIDTCSRNEDKNQSNKSSKIQNNKNVLNTQQNNSLNDIEVQIVTQVITQG